jgi:hypothetical protein
MRLTRSRVRAGNTGQVRPSAASIAARADSVPDAVLTYQDNFDVADNPATPVVEPWGQATSLLSPRFVRLTMQFDFYMYVR